MAVAFEPSMLANETQVATAVLPGRGAARRISLFMQGLSLETPFYSGAYSRSLEIE